MIRIEKQTAIKKKMGKKSSVDAKKMVLLFLVALSLGVLLFLLVLINVFINSEIYMPAFSIPKRINGLVFLIENEADITGLLKWEKELDKIGITALVKAEKKVFEQYPNFFRRLASKGYEIAAGYSGAPCWDMPYSKQYEIMKEYQEFTEGIIGKKIRVFSCKYFSYDENTIRAAEELGIEYLLARGTQDVRAVVYHPEEYNVGLISVSNVEFEDMGRGSLCDISLWARGSTGEEFAKVFGESIAKNPDSMILVSHAHLGGTRAGWWQVYEKALQTESVVWRSFDDWLSYALHLEMPNEDIPQNREVRYLIPKPSAPLEELELIPELKTGEKIIIFHNRRGPMCLKAKEFLEAIDYPFEEHLETEEGFWDEIIELKEEYGISEGPSNTFGYFPIILFKGKVYSGFDEGVKTSILEDLFEE